MQSIDRRYAPGEILRIDGMPERRFVVLMSQDGYYLVRELTQNRKGEFVKQGRLLIVPGDMFEGRPGREQEIPGYVSPTIEDLGFDENSVLVSMRDLISQFERYGFWRGHLGELIEWEAAKGRYRIRMPDGKYAKLDARSTAKYGSPVRLKEDLSEEEQARYIGVRTMRKGGGIREVVYVDSGYALVVESELDGEIYRQTRHYVIPLSEIEPVPQEEDDESSSIELGAHEASEI